MEITRENYESWFLDYLEGRLEEGMMDEFIRFVHENPDLKEELSGYEAVSLDDRGMVFEGKEKLKKEVFDLPETFDEAAIARMEGDLEPFGMERFEDYLQRHPEKRGEADLFLLTRLVPDTSLVFPGKKKLLRTPVIRLILNRALQIAAVLLVAVLVRVIQENHAIFPGKEIQVAETEITGTGTITPDQENLQESLPELKMRNSGERNKGKGDDNTAGQAVGNGSGNETAFPGTERPMMADNRPDARHDTHRKESNSPLPSGTFSPSAENPAATITRNRETIPELPVIRKTGLETASPPVTLAKAAIPPAEEPLLADTETELLPLDEILLEKTGLNEIRDHLDDLTISKVTRFGLKLASTLTKEKFNYNTNADGEIIAFNLDTKLLGLSIPVRKE